MTFFMALTPPDEAASTEQSSARRLEKAIVLKDGFSFPAFLLTGLWLLYKRLWLAFAGFVLVWLTVAYGLPKLGLPNEAIGLVQLVIGLFLGHEGHAMVERRLVRKGWRLAGVIEAKDMDEAERRFFEQALEGHPMGREATGREATGRETTSMAPAPRYVAGTASGSPIIGLFPQARGR